MSVHFHRPTNPLISQENNGEFTGELPNPGGSEGQYRENVSAGRRKALPLIIPDSDALHRARDLAREETRKAILDARAKWHCTKPYEGWRAVCRTGGKP